MSRQALSKAGAHRTVAARLEQLFDSAVAEQRRHLGRVTARAEHNHGLGGPLGAVDEAPELLQQKRRSRRVQGAATRHVSGQVALNDVDEPIARGAQHVAELGQLGAELHLVVVHERLVGHDQHRLAQPQRLGDGAGPGVPNDEVSAPQLLAETRFVPKPWHKTLEPIFLSCLSFFLSLLASLPFDRCAARWLVQAGADLQRNTVEAVAPQCGVDAGRVDGDDEVVELRRADGDKNTHR